MKKTCKNVQVKMSLWFAATFIIFSKSQGGKIQTKKQLAFQLAEERRKERGFSRLSDGWTVGPVSATGRLSSVPGKGLIPWYQGDVPSSVPGDLFWVPGNIFLSLVT